MCYRGVKESVCFLHLPVFISFWNISQLLKKIKWSPDNLLPKGRNITTDLGYNAKFHGSFFKFASLQEDFLPSTTFSECYQWQGFLSGLWWSDFPWGWAKHRERLRHKPSGCWDVYCTLISWRCSVGMHCVDFTFYCIGYCCLVLPAPVLQTFFPSGMQKTISYTQSTWDIKWVILVGSCFKVSLFRFRGGIMES